jgi:glycyl-tRNA synthetase
LIKTLFLYTIIFIQLLEGILIPKNKKPDSEAEKNDGSQQEDPNFQKDDNDFPDDNNLENIGSKVMTLAKRRGFFWNSNEIYGGSAGFFDYGPLGARLESNLVEVWREYFVINEGFLEISTPIVTPEQVFDASGHVKEFTDLMVECKSCSEPYRADHLLTEYHSNPDNLTAVEVNDLIMSNSIKCQNCGGDLKEAYPFNLMFQTKIGPGSTRKGYLRPETAQGIFVNFHLLYRYAREKLPFGAVQVGRAFRNEISPRQGIIRLREFRMMELEYFVDPEKKTHSEFERMKDTRLLMIPSESECGSGGDSVVEVSLSEALEKNILCNELIAYFIGLTYQYLTAVGLKKSQIRFRQHQKTEMAHYAEDCWDAEINTSYGWIECVGIADRSCYDLEQHIKASGHTLAVTVHHPSPIEKEVKKIVVNNKALGMKYKTLAKKIKTALEEFDSESIPGKNEAVEIQLNGEKYTIEPDCFDIENVIEKEYGRKIIPHVIEPSFGLDRILFALIENSFYERENGYRVLSFRPKIAPTNVGVFPLMTKPELTDVTKKCLKMLREKGLYTFYDESGSIGRRYARMDETGTPLLILISFRRLLKI